MAYVLENLYDLSSSVENGVVARQALIARLSQSYCPSSTLPDNLNVERLVDDVSFRITYVGTSI